MQATVLDGHAMLGLLIVMSIWTLFDLLHKVLLLIKRPFRHANNRQQYVVEHSVGTSAENERNIPRFCPSLPLPCCPPASDVPSGPSPSEVPVAKVAPYTSTPLDTEGIRYRLNKYDSIITEEQ